VQESVLEQLKSFLTDSSLQRDPARKMAISVNSATALLGALKVAVKETSLAPGDVRSDAVESLIKEILRVSFRLFSMFRADLSGFFDSS
jgi:HEAT repeat-containing protein 5